MGRVGLIMAGVALVAVALSSLIPLIGWFLVAPLAALIIGAGAGWWALKALGGGSAGRGAGAGAIAGIGALIGSVIGLALLGAVFASSANDPAVQQEFQRQLEAAREQNPDAAVPDLDLGALATGGSILGGFCFGLVDLLLSTIGGLIAGIIYGRNRAPAAAPAGSYADGTYPAAGTGLPPMTNTLEPDREGGARIYPDDERRE